MNLLRYATRRTLDAVVNRNRFLALDIEIARPVPADASDIKAFRPLGVSCAAVVAEGEDLAHKWYSVDELNHPATKMNRRDLAELVTFLTQQSQAGFDIITWNGLHFDFDILSEESGLIQQCKQLALNHVDLMFQFFCRKAFMLSLDSASKAIGLPGKINNLDTASVPGKWAEGHHDAVLDYVINDCKLMLEVAKRAEVEGAIAWKTRTGSVTESWIGRWRSVTECLKLKEPDTSWMNSTPMPRSRFLEWLQ